MYNYICILTCVKKVLIITYYWPPNGGTGVQRWMHFSRHLKSLGWDITVFTPDNSESSIHDDKLLDYVRGIKVIKSKIWEPMGLYKKFTGKKKNQKIQPGFLNEGKRKNISEKIALWIRANYFIPDAKCFWIKPSVKKIIELQKKEKFTHLISTGPPHSVHVIAKKVKEQVSIKWLADFRDPWTNIDWFPKLPLNSSSLKKHHSMEFEVLSQADEVVTVTPTLSKELSEISGKEVSTITNGYEENDFEEFKSHTTDKIIFFHHGSMNSDRNPIKLWEFLSKQIRNSEDWNKRLEIQCYGAIDSSVINKIKELGLSNHFKVSPFVAHNTVIKALEYASICFLPINKTQNAKGIMPNKLYEYIASDKPIVLIGPKDGDAASKISHQKHVLITDFDEDIKAIEIEKILKSEIDKSFKYQYSRKNLSKELNEVLIKMV